MLVKRILWTWLRYALAMEAALAAVAIYVSLENGVAVYRDTAVLADFAAYAAAVMVASGLAAALETLAGPER